MGNSSDLGALVLDDLGLSDELGLVHGLSDRDLAGDGDGAGLLDGHNLGASRELATGDHCHAGREQKQRH